MDITEFYNEHFSTTKNPSGTDIFERDYNYRELIFFAKEYHKKQLSLCSVVASLLCVDSEGFSFIREGETYNLIEESDTLYKIADDDGYESWYDKKHFVKIQD